MNKWILRLVSLLVVMGLLVGCASEDNNKDATSNNNQTEETENNADSSEINEEMVVITISKDEGAEEISEKEIMIEDGQILMDVMKENFELEDDGGFITSIDGVTPEDDEQKAWMYFVNDEMAMVGAEEYELAAGDKVTFDLQAWD